MNIGRRIVQEEQNGAARAEYGKHIIEIASEALTKAFGKGYGATSLRNCRKFYLKFKALSIQQPLLAEFGKNLNAEFVQTVSAQIVQTVLGQLPKILKLTTSKTNQLWTLRN